MPERVSRSTAKPAGRHAEGFSGARAAGHGLCMLFKEFIDSPPGSKLVRFVCLVALCAGHGACDRDGDGYGWRSDCDDRNAEIHPGADDFLCDGIDNNCNGLTDELGPVFYIDRDGDGAGDALGRGVPCLQDGAANNSDCNDQDPLVHPGLDEICNGFDDNCDGNTDLGPGIYVARVDADGDGYPDLGPGRLTCSAEHRQPDCAPGDPALRPGATEICNGLDDDCDGIVDGDCVQVIDQPPPADREESFYDRAAAVYNDVHVSDDVAIVDWSEAGGLPGFCHITHDAQGFAPIRCFRLDSFRARLLSEPDVELAPLDYVSDGASADTRLCAVASAQLNGTPHAELVVDIVLDGTRRVVVFEYLADEDTWTPVTVVLDGASPTGCGAISAVSIRGDSPGYVAIGTQQLSSPVTLAACTAVGGCESAATSDLLVVEQSGHNLASIPLLTNLTAHADGEYVPHAAAVYLTTQFSRTFVNVILLDAAFEFEVRSVEADIDVAPHDGRLARLELAFRGLVAVLADWEAGGALSHLVQIGMNEGGHVWIRNVVRHYPIPLVTGFAHVDRYGSTRAGVVTVNESSNTLEMYQAPSLLFGQIHVQSELPMPPADEASSEPSANSRGALFVRDVTGDGSDELILSTTADRVGAALWLMPGEWLFGESQ